MRIVINGQTYADPSQLPPDVRARYEQLLGGLADRDGNGIPDIFEMDGNSLVQMNATSEIVINGRYHSPDEMPAGDRKLYEQMQQALLGNLPHSAFEPQLAPGWSPPKPITAQVANDFERRASGPSCLVHALVLLIGMLLGLALAIGLWVSLK